NSRCGRPLRERRVHVRLAGEDEGDLQARRGQISGDRERWRHRPSRYTAGKIGRTTSLDLGAVGRLLLVMRQLCISGRYGQIRSSRRICWLARLADKPEACKGALRPGVGLEEGWVLRTSRLHTGTGLQVFITVGRRVRRVPACSKYLARLAEPA